jgi:hypothetical protein
MDMRTAFTSAGWRCWGWVYNNQYQNEYQMHQWLSLAAIVPA